MKQQEGQSNYFEDQRKLIGFVLFICQALASTVEVFLRRSNSFGERYFGIQAAVGLACILFYPVFWEGHDLRPVLWFFFAYVAMMAYVRARILTRARLGRTQPHTLYSGTPRLMWLSRRKNEVSVKCTAEPTFVFIGAVLFMEVSEPLGAYLMLASLGLFVSGSAMAGYERRRLMEMNDAHIEQRNMVQGFRDMHDNRDN